MRKAPLPGKRAAPEASAERAEAAPEQAEHDGEADHPQEKKGEQ